MAFTLLYQQLGKGSPTPAGAASAFVRSHVLAQAVSRLYESAAEPVR